MKKGQNISKCVKCPAYHKHDAHRIFCEGIGHGAIISTQYFQDNESMMGFMHTYCMHDWTECVWAQATLK